MITCPICGESYYQENYSTTTCIGWTPIFKNGVLMNENPNDTITYCTCCNCGHNFSYSDKDKSQHNKVQASLDCIVPRTAADSISVSTVSCEALV